MIHASPSDHDPLGPVPDAGVLPVRNAAAQRRAMQAAMANAVRAMRSQRPRPSRITRGTAGRRPPSSAA